MQLETPFGLVLGFIHDLQFVTTITYSTNARLHNLQALHSNLFTLSSAVLAYLSHGSNTSLTKLHAPDPRYAITYKVS
jgi:hypothetical protein